MHTDLFTPWPVVRPMREARLLRELGREVTVVSWIKDPSSPLPDREVREGLDIRRVKLAPPAGTLSRAVGYAAISRRFADEIIAVRPDAILCHDLEMLWAAVRAGRSLRVPVLYHSHEDWPAMVSERSRIEGWAFTRLERRLVRRVDHVYTVGEHLAAQYRALGRPVTIQYGSKAVADMPSLGPEEKIRIRAAFGLRPADFLVGIVGSLGGGIAFDPILDALASRPAHVKLFVVGGSPERIEDVRARCAKRGLGPRAAFTGPLPTPEYLRHVALLDVGLALFLPTNANVRRVVPLKLFDYMGLGIPVVVSDFPSMKDIVVADCAFGVAVDPSDSAAIARAIRDLEADPDRRRALADAGRRCFEARYAWDRMRERLEASHPIFRATQGAGT